MPRIKVILRNNLTKGVPFRDYSLYVACPLHGSDPSSVVLVYGIGDVVN